MTTAAPSGAQAEAGSADAAYIRMFLSRRKRYMSYPSQVHIETVETVGQCTLFFGGVEYKLELSLWDQ